MVSSITIVLLGLGSFLSSCLVQAVDIGDLEAPAHVHASTRTETTKSISILVELMNSAAIVFLVTMAAIFSGLTLGLMSLDKTGLEVIIGAGEACGAAPDEAWKAALARQILPIRNNGNLLLTTLILGNVAVNSLLSIFMADLTSGLAGFLISTVTIVICGEIIPQAICSRHALAVGAKLVPLVRVLIKLFYFAGKPVSVALDYTLGADVGTIFTKRELQKLLEIHVKQKALHPHEGRIVRGAMSYRQKCVISIMVPVDQIYSISATTLLSMETIKTIYQSGFSRVPVWKRDRNDVIGVFFVKDLVLIDPNDNIPAGEFVQVFGCSTHRVWSDTKLGDVLSDFKAGHNHMAFVYDANSEGNREPLYELKGMITLSDIVEEILQAKIGDETGPCPRPQLRTCRVALDYV